MAEPSALYAHRGTRAIQRMVEFAPSTGGLALWVRHLDLPADPAAPAAATNGHTVFYGESFERLPVAEQAGLVAHEVLHIALRHPQRFLELQQLLGDVDLRLFNICADAIVNSALGHLSWLDAARRGGAARPSAARQALGLDQGVEAALLEWDVERLYRAIDDRGPLDQGTRARIGAMPRDDRQGCKAAQDGSQGGTQGQETGPDGSQGDRSQHGAMSTAERPDGPRAARVRALGAGIPIDLLPGADTRASPESEAEQAREWSERLSRAHAGDGAHSMLRTLIADLPRTRTPWEQLLRTQLARSLSHRLGVSWSRPARSYLANQGRVGPHRRMPWEPGVTPSREVPRLVVIVDVSGSIEDALMERFAREIEAITRRLEAGLVLVIGDERVQKVQRFEAGRGELRDIEFKGGGGTDFTPLLEEADRHRPDIVVVLTDLDGPARFQPRWPVIWAVPEAHRAAVAPFGRKLVLTEERSGPGPRPGRGSGHCPHWSGADRRPAVRTQALTLSRLPAAGMLGAASPAPTVSDWAICRRKAASFAWGDCVPDGSCVAVGSSAASSFLNALRIGGSWGSSASGASVGPRPPKLMLIVTWIPPRLSTTGGVAPAGVGVAVLSSAGGVPSVGSSFRAGVDVDTGADAGVGGVAAPAGLGVVGSSFSARAVKSLREMAVVAAVSPRVIAVAALVVVFMPVRMSVASPTAFAAKRAVQLVGKGERRLAQITRRGRSGSAGVGRGRVGRAERGRRRGVQRRTALLRRWVPPPASGWPRSGPDSRAPPSWLRPAG